MPNVLLTALHVKIYLIICIKEIFLFIPSLTSLAHSLISNRSEYSTGNAIFRKSREFIHLGYRTFNILISTCEMYIEEILMVSVQKE